MLEETAPGFGITRPPCADPPAAAWDAPPCFCQVGLRLHRLVHHLRPVNSRRHLTSQHLDTRHGSAPSHDTTPLCTSRRHPTALQCAALRHTALRCSATAQVVTTHNSASAHNSSRRISATVRVTSTALLGDNTRRFTAPPTTPGLGVASPRDDTHHCSTRRHTIPSRYSATPRDTAQRPTTKLGVDS